jgi:hypothetical protein
MALGVGATTAIYSVIDATLLHPLPYPNPTELVRLEDDLPGVGAQDVGISVPEWRDLQSSGIFQYVSIYGFGVREPHRQCTALRISFKPVTPNYFAVLGVDAQLGRTFDPHDTTPGFNLEVVISDGLWRREFGADPHILGKTSAPGQRCLSCRGRHAGRFSRSGPNQRGAEYRTVGGKRLCRSAVSASAARVHVLTVGSLRA